MVGFTFTECAHETLLSNVFHSLRNGALADYHHAGLEPGSITADSGERPV